MALAYRCKSGGGMHVENYPDALTRSLKPFRSHWIGCRVGHPWHPRFLSLNMTIWTVSNDITPFLSTGI